MGKRGPMSRGPGRDDRRGPRDSDDADRQAPPDSADNDRPTPPGDEAESHGKRNAKRESPFKEMESALAKILTEDQMSRLKQIALQLSGVRGLLSSENTKNLDLTKEQIAKLKKAKSKDAKKVIAAVLTTEQEAKWEEMVGKEFTGKISFGGPGGPNGGPGGGPGGRRGPGGPDDRGPGGPGGPGEPPEDN
jgi:hypothetical protein